MVGNSGGATSVLGKDKKPSAMDSRALSIFIIIIIIIVKLSAFAHPK